MSSHHSEPSLDVFIEALAGIPDRDQRGYALASRLEFMDDESIVCLVKEIMDCALGGKEGAGELYRGLLTNGIGEVLGAARMSNLVTLAQDSGFFETVAIYMDLPVEAPEDAPIQPFLDGEMKETPLGMRKALARKPDFALIDRIAHDQDPRVISVLLNNPRLTEKDVIRIGSTRPTSPRVLEELFKSRKWIVRYSIKKTIVFNPHTPLSLSMRLLPFMQIQDLRHVTEAHDLDPLLRETATKMARKKDPLAAEANELSIAIDE